MSNEKRLQQIRDAARYKYPDERIHFIDGAKWADSHPAWVSVEERLPEKENEFEDYSKLVVVTNGKDFWKGMYNYGGEDWRTFDLWLIDDATHWMEIVPPVKKGGNNEND